MLLRMDIITTHLHQARTMVDTTISVSNEATQILVATMYPSASGSYNGGYNYQRQ